MLLELSTLHILLLLILGSTTGGLASSEPSFCGDENCYDVLGVPRSCSDIAEIKKAYRQLALKRHPDKVDKSEDTEKATSEFARIARAYEVPGLERYSEEVD